MAVGLELRLKLRFETGLTFDGVDFLWSSSPST